MHQPPPKPSGYLPRLAPEFYQGDAVVFWTHTLKDRAQGWLTPVVHAAFRELMLHTAVRESLVCPIYVLMPDHLHLVWMGMTPGSDQKRATAFLRTRLLRLIAPHVLQHQPHDHVLRDNERVRDAFAATCAYIANNPARAGLTTEPSAWPYLGCLIPGYPDLQPIATDYWDRFWPIYNAQRVSGRLGKVPSQPSP